MADDLDALLARAMGDLEGRVSDVAGSAVTDLARRVRRRRARRHAFESVAGLGAVAVVGVAAWFGAGRSTPPPVLTPDPTPTVTQTPTPTPTPTPTDPVTPTAGPTPQVPTDVPTDDVAGIARVVSPSTGETWQDPVESPEMERRLGVYGGEQVYLVGHRGAAEIYVRVVGVSTPFESLPGLYEVVGDSVSVVECPVSASVCTSYATEQGLVADRTTRYESLALPSSIRVSPTFGVTTTATVAAPGYTGYGSSWLSSGTAVEVRTLRQIGRARVVEMRTDSEVPGTTATVYAYVTPMGSVQVLDPQDVVFADLASFTWDDGQDRPTVEWRAGSIGPGTHQCFPSLLLVESAHVDADWRPAATTSDGRRVFVPVAGGNAVSHAVFEYQRDSSWGFDETGESVSGAQAYHLTEAEFLAQDSLYAVQDTGGEWLLGMRPSAAADVWECA